MLHGGAHSAGGTATVLLLAAWCAARFGKFAAIAVLFLAFEPHWVRRHLTGPLLNDVLATGIGKLLGGLVALLAVGAVIDAVNSGRPRGRRRPRAVNGRNFSATDKRKIVARSGGRCRRCGTRKNLHFDHIRPYSRGGKSTAANGQLLCARHNLSKGNRYTG